MFQPLDSKLTKPSEELGHFTNRVDELSRFDQLLAIPNGEPVPVLMFYGVGGTGKTWLLRRLHGQAEQLPKIYIDLDPRIGSQSFLIDPARALGEIRRQLGSSVKCPRFDLAYTWLRSKEGVADEPLFKGSGVLGNAWEFLIEVGDVAVSEIPGATLATWLLGKVTSPIAGWLSESGVADWLATKLGQEDFLKLKDQLPGDIYPGLHHRLLQDLRENLPLREDYSCRAVVFIDTIEAIHNHRASNESTFSKQEWLRNLYHPESGLLIVLGGRDRLNWDLDSTSPFANKSYFDQHLVGGLSKNDAVSFLMKCGIADATLQKAILKVSEDTESEPSEIPNEIGYHPFSVGLCADTCWNEMQRGEMVDPVSFDITGEDTGKLAERFLRSMGGDGTYAQWLKRLSLTHQFDEGAARACFSDENSAEQDFAWRALTGYSFLRRSDASGQFSLHTRMRESLDEIQQIEGDTHWRFGHEWWQDYWQIRSKNDIDQCAAKAWYHLWCIDPRTAQSSWLRLIKLARQESRMADHYTLLSWWLKCSLEQQMFTSKRDVLTASALFSWGTEYGRTTLGDHDVNLRQAIACFEATLRVRTEEDFPKDWAMTQNNLGNAYLGLPSGDRDTNLRQAIVYYKAALRVRTEKAYPQDWATTQNNLAIAYRNLPLGDREANVRQAIVYYKSALRVRTEKAYPQDWVRTQNNLAIAYWDLPSGDRNENVHQAINCYKAALRVYIEKAYPQDWAMTQNNLGLAYRDLPLGDRNENVRLAIAYFEAALRIRTEKAFPYDWATTQDNLGIAYRDLPLGDRNEKVRLAIACFKAALRVFTEKAYPEEHSNTMKTLNDLLE